MITLITGTPDSGKSALAEDLATDSGRGERYYLATMKVCDEAGIRRILKHRKLREGKGFVTIELPYAVDRALTYIKTPRDAVVLLECLSNLAGNEMHDHPQRAVFCQLGSENPEAFVRQVLGDIRTLAAGVGDLIIVTNEYEQDDAYDEDTKLYIRLCHMLNRALSALADQVIDVRKQV